MLKTLKVHNFKTFLNTELRFGKRHLLIGKNNSGKTSLVKALDFLAWTAKTELDKAVSTVPGGIEEICNWKLKSDEISITAECALEFDGLPHDFTYELHLERRSGSRAATSGQDDVSVVSEQLSVAVGGRHFVLLQNNGKEAALLHEDQALAGNQQPHRARTLSPKNATMLSRVFELESNRRTVLFRSYLQNWRYFSLSPFAIRHGSDEIGRGSSASLTPPGVFHWWTACDPLGFGLSHSIYQLKNYDDRRYRRIIEQVKMIEPSLEAINFIPAPGQQPVPFITLTNQPRASWQGLSDGTLRALGIALIVETAAACSPPTNSVPSLSFIEEPEDGIYPGVLRRFYDLFEEWAPTSQFIFTSHSPYFIDMFDDKRESVTIFRKATDRSESLTPPRAEVQNGDDRLTLSDEYALELYQ